MSQDIRNLFLGKGAITVIDKKGKAEESHFYMTDKVIWKLRITSCEPEPKEGVILREQKQMMK